jgi:AcrR family transcriptional regulator
MMVAVSTVGLRFARETQMTTVQTRETYRHGNVRIDAINAAFEAVTATGYEALSLRRVADAIGVAHRSLYNHFSDREALLDAVAEHGFEQLAFKVGPAATGSAFVEHYVAFALHRPNLYALMMSRPHATMKRKPALQAAVHLSITEAMRHFSAPNASSQERRRSVMKMLVLLHGSLSLYSSGILDLPSEDEFVREIQDMVGTA